jgi:hypothetical protein
VKSSNKGVKKLCSKHKLIKNFVECGTSILNLHCILGSLQAVKSSNEWCSFVTEALRLLFRNKLGPSERECVLHVASSITLIFKGVEWMFAQPTIKEGSHPFFFNNSFMFLLFISLSANI